jgi:hypothetical protein
MELSLNNITSGITTIQNISKFWDYVIPALLFILVGLIQTIFFKKDKFASDSLPNPRLLNTLPLGFSAAYILYVLGTNTNISEAVLSILSLTFAAGITYFVVKINYKVPAAMQLCIALCALNLKIFTTQGNLFIFILLNLSALVIIFRKKIDFLLAIVSIIIFKRFDFGPYIVNDLFHSSEFVISYQRGLSSSGEWNVFPNIGYLEEAIPNLIVDAISKCTLGNFQISIQDAYSLCLVFLTGGMYYFLEKKWKGVAYALTMLMTIERLTLMLVINLGLVLSTLRSNYFTWALIGVAPLIMLGLSPSYGAILVLSLALFFQKNKPQINLLIPSALIALSCVALYDDTFIYFFNVYKDWGSVNSAAHGTPMWSAPIFKTVLRLAFVFSLSFLVWQIIKSEKLNMYGCIALVGIGISLWMYLSYGFTRLDKDTGSRIFPVGIAIFVSLMPYLKRYTKVVPSILFISFFGASFATPQPIRNIDLFRQSPKMTLDSESQDTLNRYNSVAKKLSSEVIIFSKNPTLGNYIPGVKVPPFSSPWVAIGQFPQERVIAFLKSNPTLPIMLGDDFSTWDKVDVRARSPIIYQYIAQRYNQVEIDDVIVAVPSSEAKESHFFSGFNIGAAAAYYEKNKNKIKVIAPCENIDATDNLYKISNEKNFFYARLKCGVNAIPDVYFSGEHLNVSKWQEN